MPRLFAPSFSAFNRAAIRPDLIAGLTVWAVLVPESLAYATIAGVPPVVGLYAAVPALIIYAVIGSSRHLVVSPMSATAALSIGVVATVSSDPDDFVALTTGLALATGLVAVAAGLLRLGFLASFISEPVLKGFIIGLALTILMGQLPAMFGIDKGSGSFFEKAWDLLTHLDETEALTLGVGFASFALLMALRRLVPLLPASLVVALAAPSIDVTASGMLIQLRADLRRMGAELVLAEDIGQVRDVLATAEPEGEPPLYPTIEAALASVPPTSRPAGDPDTGA